MAVITLSRQSGSEGTQITKLLCERLGCKFFDKHLMAQLALNMGLSPDKMVDTSVDRHAAKGILGRAFGDPNSRTSAARQEAREAMSVQQVRSLILAAYQEGNVIIVGRGGMVALADKPDVLHVRVVAPLEVRITRWQEREDLSYDEARRRVRERDAAHIDFVQRFYGADVTDPALFDLVINTGKITPEAAVEVIVKTLEHLPVKALGGGKPGAS